MRAARTLVAVLAVTVAASGAGDPVYTIHGPTILAFFAPVKHPETDGDADRELVKFRALAKQSHEPLERAGIDFQEVYAPVFQVRVGSETATFDSGHMKVGYYFITPGKKARVEYGVAPAPALLEIAKEYFGVLPHK